MFLREKKDMKMHEPSDSKLTVRQVFLDMDGCLCDFFGAWSERHDVDHWKSVSNPAVEIEQLANSSTDEVYNFFRNLKPLAGGKLIVDWLNTNNIPFTILSAPLDGPYQSACISAKQDWLEENMPGHGKRAVFDKNKYRYAKSDTYPNLLIDDYGVNVIAWRKAGGVAIKHEDESETPDAGLLTIASLNEILISDK